MIRQPSRTVQDRCKIQSDSAAPSLLKEAGARNERTVCLIASGKAPHKTPCLSSADAGQPAARSGDRMDLLDKITRVGYHVREMRIVNHEGRSVAGFDTEIFSD